jgi:hypothetical protein
MKTFRITYTIVDGEHEYADEMIVAATNMSHQLATGHLAEFWLSDESPGYREEFGEILITEGFGFLPCGVRAITDVHWEEIKPIIVNVRKGMVKTIQNIPPGVIIEIRDWDTEKLDKGGRPVPAVIRWDAVGHTDSPWA